MFCGHGAIAWVLPVLDCRVFLLLSFRSYSELWSRRKEAILKAVCGLLQQYKQPDEQPMEGCITKTIWVRSIKMNCSLYYSALCWARSAKGPHLRRAWACYPNGTRSAAKAFAFTWNKYGEIMKTLFNLLRLLSYLCFNPQDQYPTHHGTFTHLLSWTYLGGTEEFTKIFKCKGLLAGQVKFLKARNAYDMC